METLFGTCGPIPAAPAAFRCLLRNVVASNPGAAPAVAAGGALSLGHAGRSFVSWQDDEPLLRLHLDGEILFLDGTATRHRGTDPSELRRLARLYRRHGEAFWERLDGSFCLVVEDGPALRIGVDVGGTRAVYWWLAEGVLAFASHLLDLAPCYPGSLTEDPGAIGNFLACGSYPPGRTPFRHVHHLSPGCHLVLDDGRVRVAEHFRMECRAPAGHRPRRQLVAELTGILSESIGVCWQAATRPVVPLSGGTDSRYIAAELVRRVPDRSLVRTITWGEDRLREGSDAVVAKRLAAALGVENVWHEKRQEHLATEFDRAVYLSSGEADAAIEYPDDPRHHRELRETWGFRSIFRGDECFGMGPSLLTKRPLLVVNGLRRLTPDGSGYRGYLPDEVLAAMSVEQAGILADLLGALRSPTATGCREELYYGYRFRQVLAVFNRVRHADLETYNPLMGRRVLEWVRTIPDPCRDDKRLFRQALATNFPEIAPLPWATRNNLPSWPGRLAGDPRLLQFFREVYAAPGWLDTLGNKDDLLARLTMREAAVPPDPTLAPVPPAPSRRPSWKQALVDTPPARLVWDLTLDRRVETSVPDYNKLGRLAVLHRLIGRVHQRARLPAVAPPPPSAAGHPALPRTT